MQLKKKLRSATHHSARRVFCEDLENRILFDAPSVSSVDPAGGATGVALDVKITANVNLPNGGVNPSTVTTSTVYLYPTAFPNNNSKYVLASVKTTGGGDAIILSPLQNLQVNTSYTFVVTASLKDVAGDAFTPFTEAFTTGNQVPKVSQNYAFTKVSLPTTAGYPTTNVQVGPDGQLWASTETGQILRFPMNADGTLGTPQVITSLQTAYGGNRLITGFAFDPAYVANPSSTPKIWVSNTFYALSGATNAPNFTSSLTVMSGANLQTVQDAIVDLPRSVADHVNDQPVFQPGTTNLLFCQAGENAYGAPDTTWGNRSETQLSAAILEVNTSALNLSTPLNVLTSDVGGSYNPYAVNAPLTIYATGIRNAFDLMFDDKGQLWAPANGSSSGGNTPAGGGAPALTDVQQVEEDTLIRVQKGGYYGHPDPARGQFVLDQGNPSSGAITGLAFTEYPVGTNPGAGYKLPEYVFGLHSSPDGIIEYHGTAFGGKMDGKFLVAEYSAPDDIAVLSPDSGDHIIGGLVSTAAGVGAEHGVSGLTGFNGPVSLVENNATGYIYVSELAGNKITLLKPSSILQQVTSSKTSIAFNTVATGNAGAGASRTESVTITNTGADQLTFSSISVVNDPSATAAASDFTITNASLPTSLNAVGNSFTINLTFKASIVGLESALLQIKNNDPVTPTLLINLHGIGTAGQFGSLEPSLVQILRAHNIPTIVGAGPNDVNINTVAYPEVPDPSSQEVQMQRMVAASSGPVTITALASFSTSASPVSTIGYYTPGNASATTALFTIAQADAQTVDPTPVGTTSFNPGSSSFGLYANFTGVSTPNSAADTHYTEDSLNTTLDPNNPRKIRFFPYENPNGSVVPNTFVFAVEDYNDPTYNSFVNFVGIISNVTGGPAAPTGLAVASNDANGVALTWNDTTGATTYNVGKQSPGSSTFTLVATGLTTPAFVDTDVADGSTYQYEVQSVNSVDTSAFSAAVSVTRPTTVTPPPGTPAAPTNLVISSATSTSVSLSWSASANATSYIVERLAPGDTTYAELASGLTTTSYTDTDVTVGDTYHYEVIAANSAGSSPLSTPTSTIIPQPGTTITSVTIGKKANKSVQFFNDAGTLTTIKMSGLGSATVNFAATTLSQNTNKTGVVVSGTGISIAGISTAGTTLANSVITVTTRGATNTIDLGNVEISGSLSAINAPTATLSSAFTIAGSINKLTLGSVDNGSITVGGVLGMLKVPSVTGLTLSSTGAIKAINSTVWASTQPVSAPSIGTITIANNAQLDLNTAAVHALHVKGSLHDSTFTLSGTGIVDLGTLSAGGISNTLINSSGNIGTISAGTLSDSQIYAGTGLTDAAPFPPVSSFPTSAVIAAVRLRKVPNASSFVDSTIAAGRITNLSLGTIQTDNAGTPFGVEANAVNSLALVNSSTGKGVTLTKLFSADIVTADFTAKGITPGDFAMDIV